MARITPLSSYALPCHSPFQVIGLPSRQVELTVVPNMYCLIASGLTSARHTAAVGASMAADALATRFGFMEAAPEMVVQKMVLRPARTTLFLRETTSPDDVASCATL